MRESHACKKSVTQNIYLGKLPTGLHLALELQVLDKSNSPNLPDLYADGSTLPHVIAYCTGTETPPKKQIMNVEKLKTE